MTCEKVDKGELLSFGISTAKKQIPARSTPKAGLHISVNKKGEYAVIESKGKGFFKGHSSVSSDIK